MLVREFRHKDTEGIAAFGMDVFTRYNAICDKMRLGFGVCKQAIALVALRGRIQVCAVSDGLHAERGIQIDTLCLSELLSKEARCVADERSAGNEDKAIGGSKCFLIARAEMYVLDECVDDGWRRPAIGGKHEAELFALCKREVEFLIFVRGPYVDEQIVGCLGDDLRCGERVAGAGEVEDHGIAFPVVLHQYNAIGFIITA